MIGATNALAPSIGEIGFHITVGPAVLWLNGITIISPFSIVFIAKNTTSYIFLNTTTGLLGVNTSGFATSNIPIAIVVSSDTKLLTLVDTRPDFTNIGTGGGGGGGGATWLAVNTSQTIIPTSTTQFINASGTCTLALTPATGQIYTIVNTGSGVITLTNLVPTTLYALVNQGQSISLAFDNTSGTFLLYGNV